MQLKTVKNAVSPKKSILMVGNFLSKRGMNLGISEELRKRLENNGWRVILVSSQINKWRRLTDMVFTALRCCKAYHVASIEIFSGQAFIFTEVMSFVFNLLKKPVVGTLHGGNLAVFEKQNPKRVRRVLERLTAVTTPSLFLQAYFLKLRADIIRIPNVLDLERYPYRLREKAAPKLIWLRALHEIYAPTMAVEVVHLLHTKYPDIRLIMVGPDKGDGSLEKVRCLINKYGLGDAVDIIGGVDKQDVPHWLNQGDIFINTTRIESFGVSVLEAAACGLPIVTTDAGELPYMWKDEVDALVIPVDDAKAMADAVERILQQPELTERLSVNGRHKAEHYDWSRIIPQWEVLFESLIDNE